MIVDSDDWLTPDALETIARTWESIPQAHRNEYATICGLCIAPDGRQMTDSYPEEVFDSDTIEIETKYGVGGEKALATRTSVRRRYPFPENLGRYCMCSLVSNRIAIAYKTRFVNRPLQYKDFQADGVTKGGMRKKIITSPQAFRLRNMEFLNITNRFVSAEYRAQAMVIYIWASFEASVMPWTQFREIGDKLLWLRMLPRGFYTYIRPAIALGQRLSLRRRSCAA
jgi:hypothetical protein